MESRQAEGRIVQIRDFDGELWDRIQAEAIRRKWKTAALVELGMRRLLDAKAEASA